MPGGAADAAVAVAAADLAGAPSDNGADGRSGMKARRVKGLDPAAPLADNAARIVRVRLDELCSFMPRATDPSEIVALHDMRIAAKRLRYVLEVTGPVFGETPSARRGWWSDSEPDPTGSERDHATPPRAVPIAISVEPPPTSTTATAPRAGSGSVRVAPRKASRASSWPSSARLHPARGPQGVEQVVAVARGSGSRPWPRP